MAREYVSVTGDDLPFIQGAYGYRAIVNGWEKQGKPPLTPKDVNAFCSWLGAQNDMPAVIDLAVERHTLNIRTLRSLLGITDETAKPIAGGVL